MPIHTFDSPATGSTVRSSFVCEGTHTVSPPPPDASDPITYRIKIAYATHGSNSFGAETVGSLNPDYTWKCRLNIPADGEYDLRSRMYASSSTTHVDEQKVYKIKVDSAAPVGFEEDVEEVTSRTTSSGTPTFTGVYNPAQGNFVYAALYPLGPGVVNPRVPVRIARPSLTVHAGRVEWAVSFSGQAALQGKTFLMIVYLMDTPDQVSPEFVTRVVRL